MSLNKEERNPSLFLENENKIELHVSHKWLLNIPETIRTERDKENQQNQTKQNKPDNNATPRTTH